VLTYTLLVETLYIVSVDIYIVSLDGIYSKCWHIHC